MPLTEEEEKQKIKKDVIEIMRTIGLVCFDIDAATTPELESEIQGEG